MYAPLGPETAFYDPRPFRFAVYVPSASYYERTRFYRDFPTAEVQSLQAFGEPFQVKETTTAGPWADPMELEGMQP